MAQVTLNMTLPQWRVRLGFVALMAALPVLMLSAGLRARAIEAVAAWIVSGMRVS